MKRTDTQFNLAEVSYAHSKLKAWEFVVNALVDAGFQITATYPLITENTSSMMARGKASIFSSILLLARKRIAERKGILENIDQVGVYHPLIL